MQTAVGWLFGLNSTPGIQFSSSHLTIREMSDAERNRISNSSQDFFAKDLQIWTNSIERFPLVFEKRVPDEFRFGSIDIVAALLSLLAPGEVRTPILWLTNERGGGATASASQAMELFYRFINGQFHTIDFHAIKQSATVMFEKLEAVLASDPYRYIDRVLLDRLFEAKRHPLAANAVSSDIVARSADICTALESLYGEGSSEIQFRLAISMACLLELDPRKREGVMKAVTETYGLRSKVVHGDEPPPDAKKKIESVICTDRLLRRSILTRLLNKLDDKAWTTAFRQARLGIPFQGDTSGWVTN